MRRLQGGARESRLREPAEARGRGGGEEGYLIIRVCKITRIRVICYWWPRSGPLLSFSHSHRLLQRSVARVALFRIKGLKRVLSRIRGIVNEAPVSGPHLHVQLIKSFDSLKGLSGSANGLPSRYTPPSLPWWKHKMHERSDYARSCISCSRD